MKTSIAFLLALILLPFTLFAGVAKTVTADQTTGELLWPTNLWDVESANIYFSLGLAPWATNQTAILWRQSLGLDERTTNTTSILWRQSIGLDERVTNNTAALWRASFGLNEGVPGAFGTNILVQSTSGGARSLLGLDDASPGALGTNLLTQSTPGGARGLMGLDVGSPGAFGTNILVQATSASARGLMGLDVGVPGDPATNFLTQTTTANARDVLGVPAATNGVTWWTKHQAATNTLYWFPSATGELQFMGAGGTVNSKIRATSNNSGWPGLQDSTGTTATNSSPSDDALLNYATAKAKFGVPGASGTNVMAQATPTNARKVLGVTTANLLSAVKDVPPFVGQHAGLGLAFASRYAPGPTISYSTWLNKVVVGFDGLVSSLIMESQFGLSSSPQFYSYGTNTVWLTANTVTPVTSTRLYLLELNGGGAYNAWMPSEPLNIYSNNASLSASGYVLALTNYGSSRSIVFYTTHGQAPVGSQWQMLGAYDGSVSNSATVTAILNGGVVAGYSETTNIWCVVSSASSYAVGKYGTVMTQDTSGAVGTEIDSTLDPYTYLTRHYIRITSGTPLNTTAAWRSAGDTYHYTPSSTQPSRWMWSPWVGRLYLDGVMAGQRTLAFDGTNLFVGSFPSPGGTTNYMVTSSDFGNTWSKILEWVPNSLRHIHGTVYKDGRLIILPGDTTYQNGVMICTNVSDLLSSPLTWSNRFGCSLTGAPRQAAIQGNGYVFGCGTALGRATDCAFSADGLKMWWEADETGSDYATIQQLVFGDTEPTQTSFTYHCGGYGMGELVDGRIIVDDIAEWTGSAYTYDDMVRIAIFDPITSEKVDLWKGRNARWQANAAGAGYSFVPAGKPATLWPTNWTSPVYVFGSHQSDSVGVNYRTDNGLIAFSTQNMIGQTPWRERGNVVTNSIFAVTDGWTTANGTAAVEQQFVDRVGTCLKITPSGGTSVTTSTYTMPVDQYQRLLGRWCKVRARLYTGAGYASAPSIKLCGSYLFVGHNSGSAAITGWQTLEDTVYVPQYVTGSGAATDYTLVLVSRSTGSGTTPIYWSDVQVIPLE